MTGGTSRGRFRVVAVLIACAPVLGSLVAQSPAGGADRLETLTVQKAKCTVLPNEPAVEAPQYAQNIGAGGEAYGWWCELPHATALPSGMVADHRSVADLANLYALFNTQFAPKPSLPADTTTDPGSGASSPGLILEVDVNSSTIPAKHLAYPPKLDGGTKVKINKRVTATVVVVGHNVTVEWRYPRHGVPKYLEEVATVALVGTDLSKATVIRVAASVRPD